MSKLLLVCAMAVLLAGYTNGSRRKRDKAGTRSPAHLPEPAWFMDRVNAYCGGIKHLSCQSSSKSIDVSHASVVGVALLGPGVLFKGRLTPFDLEADLLWKYWGRPEASYSVTIRDFHLFEQPVDVYARMGDSTDLGPTVGVDLLRWIFFPAGSFCIKGVDADRFGALGGDGAKSFPVLWVPDPILALVVQGKWSSLLFHLSRSKHKGPEKAVMTALTWLSQRMSWPCVQDMNQLWARRYHFFPEPVHPLTDEVACFLTQQLRRHSDILISDGLREKDVVRLAENKCLLERGLEGLEVFANALNSKPLDAKATNQALSSTLIINSIRAARHLRNRGHLKKMGDAVVESLFPQQLHMFARSLMHRPPSSSTLSRYQASCQTMLTSIPFSGCITVYIACHTIQFTCMCSYCIQF